MPASTRSYDPTKIIIGPGDLWLKVAVPTTGNRLTVDSTGGIHTPESVANPTAKHLGMTVEGIEIAYIPNVENFESDELTAPFLSRIIGEVLSIKGKLYQVTDFDLLEAMTVGGVKATGTGFEEIPVGGLSAVPTISIAHISPDSATPATLFNVVQLYKTYNKAGWNYPVTRKNPANLPFEFEGLAITTRVAGDQVGKIWHKIP